MYVDDSISAERIQTRISERKEVKAQTNIFPRAIVGNRNMSLMSYSGNMQ